MWTAWIAACGPARKPDEFRVALVTPGSISDAAWNSGAYRGLELVRDSLHVAVSHVEAKTPSEQEEALRTYAAQGYNVVFGHGFEFQGPAERVAAEYPRTVFVVTSGERVAGKVVPLVFNLYEASYLAGRVAGAITKKGVVGFIGGVEIPPVRFAQEGWENGARASRPTVQVRSVYLNTWDDVAAGREAALALIGVGVDVFHHNADAAALGLFQAAKESPGVYVFGANSDQASLAPEQVVGSAVIDLPRAILMVSEEVKSGTFVPRVEAFGLKSGVVRYVPNPAVALTLPPGLAAGLQAAADSIEAGTLAPLQAPTSVSTP